MKLFRFCIYAAILTTIYGVCSAHAAASVVAAKAPKAVALETDRPDLDFSLHRLGSGNGPTLLVVGGIQGDEPGGFSAASLLVTDYTIKSGQVWVVPNLNFPSIVKRSRGSFGDMNRKFAHVDPNDPDYEAVKKIQDIIRAPEVNVILNLHDGSGFYRPTHEGPMHNPKRWGQCVIIDQDAVDAPAFGQLESMAATAVGDVNGALLKEEHRYHVHNTETSKGDKEMEKTLSYFAVRHGKPAFGLEASKSFTTEYRAYYHIQVLESFMRQMGIAFERKFKLTPEGVRLAINSNVGMSLYDNRLVFALDNARPNFRFVPMKKNAPVDITCSTPILALLREKDATTWRVAYGNRTLTRIEPEYLDFDEDLPGVELVQGGKVYSVPIGGTVDVPDAFLIKSMDGYRVNAIGARREKADGSECNVTLRKKDFLPRYSVDKGATTYRVEIYKGASFAGMILIRFGKMLPAARDTMTAVKGSESDYGF